jgi:hypothetical protein
MGIVPIDSLATNVTVPLVVSSISPSLGLNLVGGTILTVTGSGLPHTLNEGN